MRSGKILAVAISLDILTLTALPGATLYVDCKASGPGDGLSWETAFRTVSAALEAGAAGDTIQIAEGLYTENLTLNYDVTLLGGFQTGDTPVRDPAQTPTVISGEGDATTINIQNGVKVVLDGLIITGGRAQFGGGIFVGQAGALTLRHSRLILNEAVNGGGIFGVENVVLNLYDCVLSLNCAEKGGVVSLVRGESASISHCTVAGNASRSEGAFYFSNTKEVSISDSIVYWNAGGSFTFSPGTLVKISYCCSPEELAYWGEGNMSARPKFAGWRRDQVFIRASATEPADGSEQAPFSSVEQALKAYSLSLAADSPCLHAASDGLSMGALLDPDPDPAPGRVTLRISPGVYQVPPAFPGFGDLDILGDGEQTTLKGDICGLRKGTTLSRLRIEAGEVAVATAETPLLQECTITKSPASGIHSYSSSPVLISCRIIGNSRHGIEGGSSSPILENCLIEANGLYGADFVGPCSPVLRGCEIKNNAYVGVAAAYGSSLGVYDCLISGNQKGAVSVMKAYFELQGCLIVRNRSAEYGVIEARSGCGLINHCTICCNEGESLFLDGVSDHPELYTVKNSIIYYNSDDKTPSLLEFLEVVRNSCIALPEGFAAPDRGIITEEPRFFGWGDLKTIRIDASSDPGGDGSTAAPFNSLREAIDRFDFALASDSPCVGAADDGTSIGAVQRVKEGGTLTRAVVFAPGKYELNESLCMPWIKEIRGTDAESTILEGFVKGLHSGLTLSDFTISGAIVIGRDQAPLILRCTVTKGKKVREQATQHSVAGLLCEEGATPILKSCLFTEVEGTGVICQGKCAPRFESCVFSNNAGEGLVVYGSSKPFLRKCLFTSNQLDGAFTYGRASFVECTFKDNGQQEGGGITQSGGDLYLENCLFAFNFSYAINSTSWRDSTFLEHCTISANGQGAGGAIQKKGGSLTIRNSIVWANGTPPLQLGSDVKLKVEFSCIQGSEVYEGPGNTNLDPRFAGWAPLQEIFIDSNAESPGEGTEAAPFRSFAEALDHFSFALTSESPCIGSAENGASMGAALGVVDVQVGYKGPTAVLGEGRYETKGMILALGIAGIQGKGPENTEIIGRLKIGDKDKVIRDCAIVKGGIELWQGAEAVFENVLITGSETTALKCYSGSVLHISDSVISGCPGGVAVIDSAHLQLQRCEIKENSVERSPLFALDSGRLILTECSLEKNSRGRSGNLIEVSGSGRFESTDSTFEENGTPGGAIILAKDGGAVIMRKALVRFHDATFFAGFGSAPSEFEKCTFEANVKRVIAVGEEATVRLLDSVFKSNFCSCFGGVVSVSGGGAVWVSDCVFIGNSSDSYGGVVYLNEGLFSAERCRFVGNEGETGGVLMVDRGGASFTNCLVGGNRSLQTGGVAYVPDFASFIATNCTFFGNRSGKGSIISVGQFSAVAALTNCIFWKNTPRTVPGSKTSCLTTSDPLFKEEGVFDFNRRKTLTVKGTEYELPDFVVRQGDYAILPDSPAVDAGISEGAPPLDIAGSPRQCGAAVDIGAYEFCELFQRGDVNADGKYNVSDPISLVNYLFGLGPVPLCPDAADANDDGKIEISDAVSMLSNLFGGGASLPEPFESCGSDPTKDHLPSCEYPPCRSR